MQRNQPPLQFNNSNIIILEDIPARNPCNKTLYEEGQKQKHIDNNNSHNNKKAKTTSMMDDHFVLEDVVAPALDDDGPLKEWRQKYELGTIQKNDFIEFFRKEARKYFEFKYQFDEDTTKPSFKYIFNEAGVKEGIIDLLLEFILGDNPKPFLAKLQLEGNTAAVCGKVFKNGEPTYSCRECGMDPTCVLCVSCFKQSAHRYHKYKMSTSGGGGCCDCGDEEAWKKDHYCGEHLRGKENPPTSTIITDAIKERCELAFVSILSFCVKFLEIETNASLECLDGDGGDGEGYFCTLLYNDESHTFEQVIQTLTKIAKCGQKDASEIVSSIDREGRAVVKCDNFYECCELKEAIEKQSVTMGAAVPTPRASQQLRVSVLNIRAVACQEVALQLLTWFQEFLVRHSTFRQLFARVITDKRAPYGIRHILEYDVKLWKAARTCWHRLLISGMLMEYDNKMTLAQEFSRHYATVVQDFVRDDHEHSFSIVSLSVQLFTVPSIAHYLIANEGIYYKLLHTFYHESIEKYIKNKTLHFAKNVASLAFFKRAAYILYDLRYILSFKPDVWTEDLRDGFLEGCKALLRLLNVMQGMEAVTRQTGQHMDYEPEWESAFNLHIKLANSITLVLDWCAADSSVLSKFYTMIMRFLMSNTFILGRAKTEERTVAGHVANCIIYDVGSQPVSIHLPLSRLFAGIYLHLGAHGLTFDNAIVGAKRTPEELMEPILCTQTMIAQVHAGMWRRNGYSLLHQLYFYRNVRCRGEMLDRDIVGLQIGAALIESNQYLIHLLSKFALIEWIQPDYEELLTGAPTDDDYIRQLTMIDEFLELLIVIIGERYMPGVAHVTEDDRTKKEIIQLLCIKSFSHSELNRAMPDSNNDTVLEDVIDSVAVFKKPQKTDSKGVYELRPELYDDFNMFFYHFTKEEKSKSEEMQRLRRKSKGELVCCPPPKLPKLTDGFISIANLLQCDVMMNIVATVLDRALDLKAKSFLENHLQKVLFLIGYGIQEEQSGHYPFLSFYASSQKFKVLGKLEELSHSTRVEAHRDFILWTIKQLKELQATATSHDITMQSGDSSLSPMGDADVAGSSASVVALPLTAVEQEKQEKAERAFLAAERRAKIMAQMQNAQKNFMKSNAKMFAATTASASGAEPSCSKSLPIMDWQAADGGDANNGNDEEAAAEGAVGYRSRCLGVDRRLPQIKEQSFKCILCFEDCKVTHHGPTLVYSAFVQKSKVLPPEPQHNSSVHTSSCGHVMHVNCWQDYYNNEETKEQRRPNRNRPVFFPAPQSTDFQCPYCRCLSNAVLPLTPPLSTYAPTQVTHAGDKIFPLDLWTELLMTFSTELVKLRIYEDPDLWVAYLPTCDALLACMMVEDSSLFDRIAQPVPKPEVPASWINFVQHFIKSARRHTPSTFEINESEGLLWMWHSCVYTVQALEMYLRAIDRPFKNEMSIRHESCLSCLIRASALYATNKSSFDLRNLVVPVSELLDTVFKQKGPPVIEWNCFAMMASMEFMVPNLLFGSMQYKTVVINGSMMDFYTLQLFFLANIVKAIVLYEAPVGDADISMDIDETEEELLRLRNLPDKLLVDIAAFYRKYNFADRRRRNGKKVVVGDANASDAAEQATSAATFTASPTHPPSDIDTDADFDADTEGPASPMPTPTNTSPIDDIDAYSWLSIGALFEHVKKEMREFLRCSCLFFHFVTDIEFPEEFATSGTDTFEHLCSYLGLQSNLEVYFDGESTYATLLETFASHPDILYYQTEDPCKKRLDASIAIVPCTRPVPQLVELAEDYSDLINSVSDFICPNNEREEMKTPTMCLICGQILCGQSYCCQPELAGRTVGACTYHVNLCGAEIGLFLRIRDCQIVYLGRNKGCFVQPPYLDEYGETDQGLRRGNPLRLCATRYSRIHLMWLGHGLHEEIARLNDNAAATVIQWHHM